MTLEYQPAIETEPEDALTRTEAKSSHPKFPWIRCVVVLAAAGSLVGGLQASAPNWDHQNANIFTGLTAIVAFVVVLVMIGRHQFAMGKLARYVLLLFASLVISAGLIKFEGFSGEMVPQLKFRFARAAQKLSTSRVDPSTITEIDLSAPEAVATTDSVQFLGNDRDGTIMRREFAIPKSVGTIRELWRIPIGEGWSSFSVAGDRAVTMEQREDTECVTCYRLADGELLWINSHAARHENPMGGIGPRSTPTIRDGLVYSQGASGWVGCFDLQTGEVVWTVDLLKLAGWDQTASEAAAPWGRASSPLIVNDLCVLSFGGPNELPSGINGRSLIALDVKTGDVVWTAGDDQLSYASPTLLTIHGTEQIVAVNESSVTGHKIATGEVLWSYPWPGQSNGGANCSQVISAGENRFLIGKGYGGGCALVQVNLNGENEFEIETVWTSSRILKTKFTHALVDGNVAYALSDGTMQAVDLETAEELWKQPRMSRSGHGQALLVEDVIVLQNEAGTVVFLDANPSEYKEILQLAALDARTWNIPTIAGRHLLVRNDQEAVCYLLPARD